MKQQIWTENYRISSYLVNLRKRAGLYAILNLIQDVGWLHAIHLNVQLKENQGWVFTRQKLVMQEWPLWNELLTIRTWLRPAGTDPFLYRDYELFVKDRKIGECTSTFVVMDTKTRKLSPQDWTPMASIWRPDGHLTLMPSKILPSTDFENLAQFQVRNSDIDLNFHVNNTKYAQWILDSLPLDILISGVDLHGYEVNFLAETKPTDVITVQKATEEKTIGSHEIVQFQGQRPDGKIAFTALMTTSKQTT